jgi:hypothetical protein
MGSKHSPWTCAARARAEGPPKLAEEFEESVGVILGLQEKGIGRHAEIQPRQAAPRHQDSRLDCDRAQFEEVAGWFGRPGERSGAKDQGQD